MYDRLYITALPPAPRRTTTRELLAPSTTRERIDDLADVTGWDALPDPEISNLVDFYVGPVYVPPCKP